MRATVESFQMRLEQLRVERQKHHDMVRQRIQEFEKQQLEYQNFLLESDRKQAQFVAVEEEIGAWIKALEPAEPEPTPPFPDSGAE